MQEKRKPLSGAQRRKRRVERGLPRYTEAELEGRRRYARSPASKKQQAKYSAVWTKARTKANSEYIAALKLKLGCADCGYNAHPAALDFDHLPGFTKIRGVAQMVNRPHNTLLAEIAKCEVVCANCHRIRTAERGQWFPAPT